MITLHFENHQLTHLSQVKTLSKLVLSLLQFLVSCSLSLLAVIIQLATLINQSEMRTAPSQPIRVKNYLKFLTVMSHFLQILGLEVVERLQVVLLHVIIQGVLQVSHALQSLSRLHQRGAEY